MGIWTAEEPVVAEAAVALRTDFATAVVVVVLGPDTGMAVAEEPRRDLVEDYSFRWCS